MKKNADLFRQLMLDMESSDRPITHDHEVPGYTRDEVAYHLALIVKSGFVDGPKPVYYMDGTNSTIPGAVLALRLTPAGHDFIDNLRDETVWKKVKERVATAGGSVSIEILGQLGVSVTKQLLGLSM